MTPKKDIVRRPVYTLDDGSPIPSMGKEFTMKESRFIFWYTYPGTEAFMNSGRAAVRAGYKGRSAVLQGYQLRQKPRIAEKIKELSAMYKIQMKDIIWRIAFLSIDRFFFDIKDFYRPCKRTVKIYGVEQEIDSYEAIPLNEISERNRMCIDQVTIKTIVGKDEFWYKLANREKAYKTLMTCDEILQTLERNTEEMDWKETAEIIREIAGPVIASRHDKAPEGAI
jgi:hypothetical protein